MSLRQATSTSGPNWAESIVQPTRPRVSMAAEIADQIRSIILERKLEAGADIGTESDLSAIFGASRPTIREALSALEAQGVLQRRTGARGLVVAQPEVERFSENMAIQSALMALSRSELLEAQTLLEVGILELVIERIDQASLARLEGLNREAASSLEDLERFTHLGMQFHQELATLSGNRLLSVLMASISTIRRSDAIRASAATRPEDVIERSRRILEGHEDIWKALSARDAQRAREAMEAHLEQRRQDHDTRTQR